MKYEQWRKKNFYNVFKHSFVGRNFLVNNITEDNKDIVIDEESDYGKCSEIYIYHNIKEDNNDKEVNNVTNSMNGRPRYQIILRN